jgi:hypothetical protein
MSSIGDGSTIGPSQYRAGRSVRSTRKSHGACSASRSSLVGVMPTWFARACLGKNPNTVFIV